MEKKKLLIFAHYYYPDVASTGQILSELAEGMTDTFEITVICVVPSYSGVIAEDYKLKKYYFETINDVKILRVRVPGFCKSSKVSRVKNIITYFFRAIFATFKLGKQDYVFSISQPPILGGLLGVAGKWLKHAKFIYNIQDFNPEQTMAINYSKNKMILKLMMFLDNFSCKHSDKVIVVGRDMEITLKERFQNKRVPIFTHINNWIDEKKIHPLPLEHESVISFKKKYGLMDKLVIMYSGNLGLYYDLENILKVIAKFKTEKNVIFAFVGDGSIKEKLIAYKNEKNLDNVIFIPYQPKDELIYSLNAGDIHWVVNAKGIKGVSVPSKIYGVMATGKPVIGILEKNSEARLIIESSNCGYISNVDDMESLEALLKKIFTLSDEFPTLGENGHRYLLSNFRKSVSIAKYKDEISII